MKGFAPLPDGRYLVTEGRYKGLICEDASGDPGPTVCPNCGRPELGYCPLCKVPLELPCH